MDEKTVKGPIRNRFHEAFMRFLVWREQHVKERTFTMFLALLVGILGGLAALVLKIAIHYISRAATSTIKRTGRKRA